MSNLPLRKLGELGILPDVNPYDLPLNAFSAGSNVVFDETRVERAPVFKQLYPAIRSSISIDDLGGTMDSHSTAYEAAEGSPVTQARFVGSYADPVSGETLFVADVSGEVRGYPNGTVQFLSPGSALVENTNPWTHAQIAGMSFMARRGMIPYVRNIKDNEAFQYLGGDWPSDYTTAILRGYNDFAIALNVTKGSQENPTLVKWSNPIPYGSSPADVLWDPTNPNFTAGENPLGEMTSAIRDGLSLGMQFVIYSQDQVWLMEYTGSTLVFNFRRLFPTGGIINTNCVVEVDGTHFVFGEDDIYAHDGISKKSLGDGRDRRYVFSSLDRTKRESCFVQHDPVSNLVFFCYPSRVDEDVYKNTQFCNRAAIYNYRSDTWSFMDLPNITGGASANLVLSENGYLQGGPGVYELYNTSYASFDGNPPRLSVMLGATNVDNGLTESRVYAIDLPTAGVVNLPAHTETVKPAWVERRGIDLDDPGLNLKLRSYKVVTGIVPQVLFDGPEGKLRWLVGSSDQPNGPVKWYSDQVYDPNSNYKIDVRVGGRYLAYKVIAEGIDNFRLSGFDAEIIALSHR